MLEYLAGGGESLQRQYASLFGKIVLEDGMISLAHPRIAREFLLNIGTIVSEGLHQRPARATAARLGGGRVH